MHTKSKLKCRCFT